MAEQDTEFTLSTGKLLGFFFGMVIICGVFFSLGYGVGKSAATAAANTIVDSSSLSTVSNSGAAKPSASRPEPVTVAQKDCAPGDANCQPAATTEAAAADISVQKQLQQKDANPQLMPVKAEEAQSNASKTASAVPGKTPELETPGQPGAGFMVQVAAVSKQEDADALVNALRKKQYPVFVVNQASSKLFHVQVGPFVQQKDAEAMRAKLQGDGYNAILKK